MNEKLKSVKLGAPESIAVNNCGTLDNLDVQITERLESISFKGNTGTKTPFERTADLLRQQEEERNIAEGIDGVSLSLSNNKVAVNGGDARDFYWKAESTTVTIDQRGNLSGSGSVVVSARRYEDRKWLSGTFNI